MRDEWTFGRKLGFGFAATVIAFAVVASTGLRTMHTLIGNGELVSHTHAVRVQLALLVSELIGAESAERGFVIAGEDRFLDTYRTAVGNVDRAYNTVLKLTADNPSQQRKLVIIRPMIDQRIGELQTVLDARRTDGLTGGVRAVAAAHGQETT
ncbi:MAG TPA: CHASE3 domain-containing protein, partial [Kofleriaceae bacterium]